jgi:hypothetical protein
MGIVSRQGHKEKFQSPPLIPFVQMLAVVPTYDCVTIVTISFTIKSSLLRYVHP